MFEDYYFVLSPKNKNRESVVKITPDNDMFLFIGSGYVLEGFTRGRDMIWKFCDYNIRDSTILRLRIEEDRLRCYEEEGKYSVSEITMEEALRRKVDFSFKIIFEDGLNEIVNRQNFKLIGRGYFYKN